MGSLEIINLEAKIGDFTLGPISVSFKEGCITAILGPSGSGKSTFLKTICGLLPSKGKVVLNNHDLSNTAPHLRRMAMMFQSYALFPNMNTFKNISFPLNVKKVKSEIVKKVVHTRAREMNAGLEESLSFMPKALPDGLKQATAFARETIRDFDVFMLDEPFSRLDAYQKQFVRVDLKKRLLKMKKTCIVVLSDAIDALSLAEKIAVLIDGKIAQFGDAIEVYDHPENLEVARIMSPLGLNVVDCRDFEVPPGSVLSFRPSGVYESENGMEFEINSIEPLDSRRGLFHLKRNDCEVVALLSNAFSKKVGQKVRISLEQGKSWIFKGEKIERTQRFGRRT